ncbi:MAG: RNA polymerase-binding protein DksA [Candidatus Schekmanbacteria bacterium]|nr:RNA polymerase-binding protein DksA [Candidatus Schekmanbacteria bacterium]
MPVKKKKKVVKKPKVIVKEKKQSLDKYSEIKKILELRKSEILKDVEGAFSSSLHSETEAYPDLTDLASAESDRNFTIRIRERERNLLKKIDQALEQIRNGNFGICEGCGEEIGIKRLMARPVATLCIKCKTEAEREEKARNL